MIFAAAVPVFILFLAIALDVGNWYTHRRQLQIRADAGALAAGVEYQSRLVACLQTDPVVAGAAIVAVARDYAGGTKNIGNPQGSVSTAINSSTFGGFDGSDGGNPCFKHLPDATDYVSPNGGRWTDVKVRETNIPTLFGMFGFKLPQITARARLQVAPATSDNQFVPLGIPDPLISKAEARFVNTCVTEGQSGYYLSLTDGQTKLDLTRLADQSQAPQYVTLWGPTDGQTHSLVLPSGATCAGTNRQGQNGYIPVGVEIRAAGFSWVDIDGPSCSDLHANSAASRYADCWSDPSEIRVWKDVDPNVGDPAFRNVNLAPAGGSPACRYDPHFTATQCAASASVVVGWGNRPGALSDTSHVSYSVTLNGVSLAPVSGKNGIWSGSGIPNMSAGGVGDVSLTWSWSDTNTADTWLNHGACKPGNKNPCTEGPFPATSVHRTFTATRDNAGALQLLQVSTGGPPGVGALLYDSANVSPTPTPALTLTVGLQSPFDPSTTNPLTVLRTDSPQGNQSLNCNTQAQGDDFDEYAGGCQKFYSVDTYAKTNTLNNTWWQGGPPHSCPAAGTIWGLPNDAALNAWLCVPTAPSPSSPAVACGLAARTGNAPGATGVGCQSNLTCAHPNRYADYIAGTDDPGDPRVVKLFVTPFAAFKNVNGSTDAVPILDFGAFYITGWGAGDKPREDPCLTGNPPGSVPDDPALDRQIVGHFVKWSEPNVGPVDLTQDCNLTELRPCRAVLVR